MSRRLPRRQFLRKAAIAGIVGVVGLRPRRGFAESPPETTRIRLSHIPSICLAPQYAAEELLRGEGFTEVPDRNRTFEASNCNSEAGAESGPGRSVTNR